MKKFKNFVTEKDRCWKGYEPVPGKKAYSKGSCRKVEEEEEEEGSEEIEESVIDYVFDLIEWNEDLQEETKDGKQVTLNKPFRTPGGPKKFAVYVKNEKGNVVKVGFGDPNMEIKRDDPDRRSNFRARHSCDDPGPKWKARYWSCKFWEKGKSVSSLLDFYDPCSLVEDSVEFFEARDPYKVIDPKKLSKGDVVDRLIAKGSGTIGSKVRYTNAEVISTGSGKPEFRATDEKGKKIIVPAKDVMQVLMKNESVEIFEAEEISKDKLTPEAHKFLKKLGNYSVEAVWSGIHGVIVYAAYKGLGKSFRVDAKTLQNVSKDKMLRWVEMDGNMITFGLNYNAVNESEHILESIDQLNNPKSTDFLVRGLKRRGFEINDLKDLANFDMIKQRTALDYLVRALRQNTDPVQTVKLRDDIRSVLSLKAK